MQEEKWMRYFPPANSHEGSAEGSVQAAPGDFLNWGDKFRHLGRLAAKGIMTEFQRGENHRQRGLPESVEGFLEGITGNDRVNMWETTWSHWKGTKGSSPGPSKEVLWTIINNLHKLDTLLIDTNTEAHWRDNYSSSTFVIKLNLSQNPAHRKEGSEV